MTIIGAEVLDRLSGLTRKSEPSLLQLAGHAQNDPCTGAATVENGPRAVFRCLPCTCTGYVVVLEIIRMPDAAGAYQASEQTWSKHRCALVCTTVPRMSETQPE
jgi:hypothetical protein